MKHYKTVLVVHEDGERLPMIIHRSSGAPVIPALDYLISHYRGSAVNTIQRVTQDIALALDWSEELLPKEGLIGRMLSGSLITNAEFYSLTEHLRRSFDHQAAQIKPEVVKKETHYIRLCHVRDFCRYLMDEAVARVAVNDPKCLVLHERINQLVRMFDDALPTPSVVQYDIKSHTAEATARIHAIIDPENVLNPFRSIEAKIRNQCIFELMLLTGMRPGELLSRRVSDISFGAITTIHVLRNPHPEDDPRPNPPAVKRLSRPLPLDPPEAQEHLKNYIHNVRPRLEQSYGKETPYLFLSVQSGAPLSMRGLIKVFETIRSAIGDPQFANLTAGSLRHTFSNNIEEGLAELGIDEEERRRHLMALRGDSSPESVEPYIRRTRLKNAHEFARRRQKSIFARISTGDEDVPF
jgi:integrase